LEPEFSDLQVLTDLGLTLMQAKIYLALVEAGPSKILEISKVSKVSRPDVYAVLSKLQQLGLAEKIVRRPIMYRATPLKKGLSFLLEEKTSQYEKVRAETQILLNTARTKKRTIKKETESPDVVLIPKGKNVIERIKAAVENAQQNIDLVLSWKRFSRGIASTFAESIESAWAKKVRVRFIIERPVPTKTAEQLFRFCRGKPCCQIKFVPNSPETIFGVYDEKEVFIVTSSGKDLPGAPALWSTNPSLIALAENCFKSLWQTATEDIQKDPKEISK
jgi:sugar-specific transcriptional regulator TrmB